jgi:hypothetical protein
VTGSGPCLRNAELGTDYCTYCGKIAAGLIGDAALDELLAQPVAKRRITNTPVAGITTRF